MGQQTLAVLAFVGIFVVVFGVRYLANRAGDKIGAKVHQTVNRADFTRQKELLGRTWKWPATASWSDIRKRLNRELGNLGRQIPGIEIQAADDSKVVLGYSLSGMRASQRILHYGYGGGEWEFRGAVIKSNGEIKFGFAEVNTVDGVARCVYEMEQVLNAVSKAVTGTDPPIGDPEA
jgi:hypothetical protein